MTLRQALLRLVTRSRALIPFALEFLVAAKLDTADGMARIVGWILNVLLVLLIVRDPHRAADGPSGRAGSGMNLTQDDRRQGESHRSERY